MVVASRVGVAEGGKLPRRGDGAERSHFIRCESKKGVRKAADGEEPKEHSSHSGSRAEFIGTDIAQGSGFVLVQLRPTPPSGVLCASTAEKMSLAHTIRHASGRGIASLLTRHCRTLAMSYGGLLRAENRVEQRIGERGKDREAEMMGEEQKKTFGLPTLIDGF
ncbi:hypothetical protein B0H19DRAFT_1068087 [Mycena capillaripes]|nr:hypothetical protein B0H19DRAFT_1068087 [Mycena capillaripes]